MSDLYSPSKHSWVSAKYKSLTVSTEVMFISGVAGTVVLSIIGGFVQEKIGLIVIRALLGICMF